MSSIVEVDDQGAIHLPDKLRAVVKPRTRFMVELQGATLILHSEGVQPFWTSASPAERAEMVRHWASLHRPPVPMLADEALRRDQMYN